MTICIRTIRINLMMATTSSHIRDPRTAIKITQSINSNPIKILNSKIIHMSNQQHPNKIPTTILLPTIKTYNLMVVSSHILGILIMAIRYQSIRFSNNSMVFSLCIKLGKFPRIISRRRLCRWSRSHCMLLSSTMLNLWFTISINQFNISKLLEIRLWWMRQIRIKLILLLTSVQP